MSPPSPFDRVSALMIVASIACVGFYVLIMAYAGAELEVRLEEEKRRRAHFELLVEQREHDLGQAHARIRELSPDEPAG